MDRLQALRTFLRVAELGSFARAAESLNASRPRVSEVVAELEAELGARLLHRTTRQVALTDDGRRYYETCSRLLADLEEADAELAGAVDAKPRGKVRLHMPVALARLLFVPALTDFVQRFPELELEVLLENRSIDPLAEGVDCAITYGAPSKRDWVARRIGSTRLLTCASPEYLARMPAIAAPGDLPGHRTLAFLALDSGRPAAWRFARGQESAVHVPLGALAFNSMEACVDAAVAGLGVTQVLSSLAHTAVVARGLSPVLLDWAVDGPPIYLIYAPNRQRSRRLRVVTEFLSELFGAADMRLNQSLRPVSELPLSAKRALVSAGRAGQRPTASERRARTRSTKKRSK